MCSAAPFGIPIDLIDNTNQKLNANSSKRATCVLHVYTYHRDIALFTSRIDCTFSSLHWHVFCKGQNIATSQLSKTHRPSLPALKNKCWSLNLVSRRTSMYMYIEYMFYMCKYLYIPGGAPQIALLVYILVTLGLW